MVRLIGEVDYEWFQSAPLLAPAEVFEGVRESDDVFKVSAGVLAGWGWTRNNDTYWLSLSTRSPKLSLPSTLGTPASSEGHLGVEGIDMISAIYIHTIAFTAMGAGAQNRRM